MCFLTFLLLYLQLLRLCYGGFIEFSDMTENLASIWSNRVPVPTTLQTKCVVSGEQIEGICKTSAQCLLSGGVPRGGCGLLSTCCTYGGTRATNSKISYFSSSDVQLIESPIRFNVIRMNRNVCQLRLDFIEFKLSPTMSTTTDGVTSPAECSEDKFYVVPGPHIPQICGENSGQHIYVDMTNELQNVTLNVKFTPRIANLPKWNIKVTQLQCPRETGKIVSIERGVAEDFLMIAPQGCLQYFTKESGNIRSLGYDGISNYAARQYYAICFRRTSLYCGINFSVNELSIRYFGTCDDYLLIPGLVIRDVNRDKLCSYPTNPPLPFNMKFTTPGTLQIFFFSNENTDSTPYTGFNIDYTLEECSNLNYYS